MSLDAARAYWKDGAIPDALRAALAAHDASPGLAEKVLLARIYRDAPDLLTADRVSLLTDLLTQTEIDPAAVSGAGWRHLLRTTGMATAAPEETARHLEESTLALTLLREDIVAHIDAELALTAARRWLLLDAHGADFRGLRGALIAQAALNGGAWPFDAMERARLGDAADFAAAYLPPTPHRSVARADADPVTRAVAEQYEAWPYPPWTRFLHNTPRSLATRLRAYDPQGQGTIPEPAEILIAGCGTGRQVAQWAQRSPRDRFTAIDLSQASLRRAEERCAALGVGNATFQTLDLHDAGRLGRRFDVVMCTGVLHHLPDPEAGWAALTGVLKPGGIMHIMVYSRVARMTIDAIRKMVGPILQGPMSDDVLREVRRRVLATPAARRMMRGRDFHSLAGTHDLLAHRHEDPFDLPRIRRGLDALGLSLIRFELPRQAHCARYLRAHPDDPLQRDFAAWAQLERDDPTLFVGMYDFWCRKPVC
jgi:2-polyprenyl-3-methyl-5-hydroxy-6-metoxy-1,4-benzoquinol methylase